MGSSSRKGFVIDEEGDGQKRNIISLDSMRASECADCEKQEPGVSDEQYLAACDSWSLFRFVGLCCSGDSSSNPSTPSPSSSWYYSARIQSMIEDRRCSPRCILCFLLTGDLCPFVGFKRKFNMSQLSSEVASEIESSKVHWSELDPTSQGSEQHSGEMNRKYFKILQRKHGDLFTDMNGLVVGKKIAEGGQAEIYEAGDLVVKVFKAGDLLQDLEKQWLCAIFKAIRSEYQDTVTDGALPGSIWFATLLKDKRLVDRFAFGMRRHWGDLRKLIDRHMIQSHNQGPPFTTEHVLWFMLCMAYCMNRLHQAWPTVLHGDLKAANVLVYGKRYPLLDMDGFYLVSVADFECSVGVVGTGLWRAPEILHQLKNRVPMSELKLTHQCDVYSFGMTCYELVSGRIPFEDLCFNEGRDLILIGDRPELPPNLDPLVKRIITMCWDPIGRKRPSFQEIMELLLPVVPPWNLINGIPYHLYPDKLATSTVGSKTRRTVKERVVD